MRGKVKPGLRAVYRRIACCALLLAAAQAQSASGLKVLATDPAADALLARQQPFFVRFELKSAAPVAVTASGLYKGQAVIDDGGTGAPAVLPAGGGTGAVSFFYWGEKPTRIDEVRLQLADPQSGAKINEYTFPVALTWLTDDAPPREPAAWVKDWQRAQLALSQQRNRTAGAAAGHSMESSVWIALAVGAALFAIAVAGWRRRARPAADDDDARR